MTIAPKSVASMADILRVALLSDYPLTEDGTQSGGVISVTYALAHALARREDVECHVVASADNVVETYRQVGNLHIHFATRLDLPRLLTDHLYDVPKLRNIVRDIDPDVVHGEGQDRHGLAAIASGYPNVVTPHGVAFIEAGLQKGVFGPLKGWLMARNERLVFEKSQDLIIISRYLPQIYGDLLQSRTHFIENPIDPAFFSLERDVVPTRLLFVGTVVPRKRVLDVVNAFAKLVEMRRAESLESDSIELRIVGPVFGDEYETSVRDLVSSKNLDSQISITGAVSQEQLVQEFQRAGMLLLASQEETAPQVIAQSLACGLPVVASKAGGVPYMVEHEKTAMLFEPGDTEDCANQINRLLNDPELRGQMSAHIVNEARKRFHPDSIAAATVDVYRQITG